MKALKSIKNSWSTSLYKELYLKRSYPVVINGTATN